MIDSLDKKILNQLIRAGRTSWAELAHILGLSAPSTADRVKRLEEHELILGYSARVNYPALGVAVTAFIAVTLSHPKHRTAFLKRVNSSSEIEECHHVTGDDDYLLKVRCRSTQHLDAFLSDQLKTVPGVLRTRTSIALSSLKETAVTLHD
jgi:Lrp/AsnC family leucine-responsive transcriptional regulator